MSHSILNHNSKKTKTLRFDNLEEQLVYFFSVIALTAIAVANQTHIETNDHVKFAPKLELLARLGATGFGGLIGIYGIVFIKRVRDAFLSFPGVWVLGLWIVIMISTPLSPYPKLAFAHLITFTSVVLFAPTAFAVLGTRLTFKILIGSMIFTLVASWFLYLAMPTYGVMIEITDESGSFVERMGGTSHPNVIAGTSVLCMVSMIYLAVERKISVPQLIPVVALCVVTLMMTGTRVAVASLLVSLFVVYGGKFFTRKMLPYTAAAACLLIFVVGMSVIQGSGGSSKSFLESFTRSGNIDEISTLTGRAEIWDYCIELISQRPLIGYGPGSPKPILEKQEMLLHTHNVILHMAFISGIMGGFCVTMLFLHQLIVSLRRTYPLPALLTLVILMNSMTENPIFDYVPGTPTLLFMMATFWPQLDDGSL